MSRILLVEDNAGDAQLARMALTEVLPDVRVTLSTDGEQALTALLGEGAAPFDLVLLDLNLPRLSGHEVLARAREADDPAVRRTPIVVMSGSAAPPDVERAYDLGACGYVIKPIGFDELLDAFSAIVRYWFGTVTPPPPRAPP